MRIRPWLALAIFSLTLLASADVKVKSRMVVSGQNMDSTTLIKGSRQRTEMQVGPGMTMTTIYQCDLKRTVQLNDRTKTYMIAPLEEETPEAPSASGSAPPAPPAPPARSKRPARSGGTLTFTTKVSDTGARKPMFGYTARQIRSEMSTQASADACAKGDTNIKTDGWYIDFPGVAVGCAQSNAARMQNRPPPSQPDCTDKMAFRASGNAKLGYPVVVDMVMKGSDGQDMTIRQETLALEKAALDAALFEIPAGYRQVASQAELMGMGDIGAMMRDAQRAAGARQEEDDSEARSARDSRPYIEGEVRNNSTSGGITRVGIVRFSGKNPGGAPETWADQLREQFAQQEMEGIELNASATDPMEKIEAEARRMGCSYFVFNDATAKVPSAKKKIGGFIGRATGVETNALENETTFKFRLFKTGDPEARLEGEVKGTDTGSLELSAEEASQQEAEQIAERIRQEWQERNRRR